LRGPGELLGVQQSGLSGLKLGDLLSDVRLVKEARAIAEQILAEDPQLEQSEHRALRSLIPREYSGEEESMVAS